MKSYLKTTAEKQGKTFRLIVQWSSEGVLVKKVVLGGFWVVSDGFCWFQMILDSIRWYANLVVIRISQQNTEELLFYCNHERTRLTEVI